jgi:hypothetical protein
MFEACTSVGILILGNLLMNDLDYIRDRGVLVVKPQWKLYQALELIPDSVAHPKSSWLGWLTAPIRRPFANVFTRDLSHRHQVLLLKRCLALSTVQQPQSSSQPSHPDPTDRALSQPQPFTGQPLPDRSELPWWTYEY